eukprot:m.49275 g.49275  ORF g.49275 m.49275 type:complete len:166 (+) comp6103_c0_seq1:1311-1808(+)
MELGIVYRPVTLADIDRALAIENAGYPADEAASYQSFHTRLTCAPELFLGAWLPSGELAGYICATQSGGAHLEEESMRVHNPEGAAVCIHSVCVDPRYRRKGIALQLLRRYIAHVPAVCPVARRLLLISHKDLLALYEKAGFECLGLSSVHHGSLPWYECALILP